MNPDEILAILKKIESDNGKNFNHPLIQHGVNRGTNAIGNYGLTHGVVSDFAKQNPNYSYLEQFDPNQKKQYLETHPEDEQFIAKDLVSKMLQRYQTPEQVAYAWNHGTSIPASKITPDILNKDNYTNKFIQLKQNQDQKPVKAEDGGFFRNLFNSDFIQKFLQNNPYKDDEEKEEDPYF